MFHEIIAAAGGLIFIIFGIARQRERRRVISGGVKTESPLWWKLFILAGICLIIFAAGSVIYKINHNHLHKRNGLISINR